MSVMVRNKAAYRCVAGKVGESSCVIFKLKAKRETGSGVVFGDLKASLPTPSNTTPLTRLHLLILPKHFTNWKTNIQNI